MRGLVATLVMALVPSLASAGDFCQFWSFLPPANQANQIRQQTRPVFKGGYELSGPTLTHALRCMVTSHEALREEYQSTCFSGVALETYVPTLNATIRGTTNDDGGLTATATVPPFYLTPTRYYTNDYLTYLFYRAVDYCGGTAPDFKENGAPNLFDEATKFNPEEAMEPMEEAAPSLRKLD